MKAPTGTISKQQISLLFGQVVTCLQRGDILAAAAPLTRLLKFCPHQPMALSMLGFVRYRQGRLAEASTLLNRSLAIEPAQPDAQMNLGYVLRDQGKSNDAICSFRIAVGLKPDLLEAYLLLANLLHEQGVFAEAEQNYHTALGFSPSHIGAKLGLSALLIDTGRAVEAEAVLRDALSETNDKHLIASLEQNLGIALGLQYRLEAANSAYERAQIANPLLDHLDYRRACLLQEVERFDEALELFSQILARDPGNLDVHRDYNNLLYRLGRQGEFLRSYDVAARSVDAASLSLAKAAFLIAGDCPEEAYEIFRKVLRRDPVNLEATAGSAIALTRMKKFEPALQILETVLSKNPREVRFYGDTAAILAQMREPQKAAAVAERGLAVDPSDQSCLAILGTAYRMMGNAREEWHNGYHTLIRVFDLEAPEGYRDMASFNADLNVYLDRLHPSLREFINQSLRGGTQTTNHIFGAGHELVERLRIRLNDAVRQYIAEINADEGHPFSSRRARGFCYSGSWSSRLHDCGRHVNHLHTSWISSCYYVAVPEVSSDIHGQQGWIKFGEPAYEVGLSNPIARSVCPKPGRLVLFPSYTWHGTVPFRSECARTTIAFDVLPT